VLGPRIPEELEADRQIRFLFVPYRNGEARQSQEIGQRNKPHGPVHLSHIALSVPPIPARRLRYFIPQHRRHDRVQLLFVEIVPCEFVHGVGAELPRG